jgi:hypothetical protein
MMAGKCVYVLMLSLLDCLGLFSSIQMPSLLPASHPASQNPSSSTPSPLVPKILHAWLQGYGVIGSTAEGPEEIEHAPSVSITLASLPGVSVSITHVTEQDLPDGGV